MLPLLMIKAIYSQSTLSKYTIWETLVPFVLEPSCIMFGKSNDFRLTPGMFFPYIENIHHITKVTFSAFGINISYTRWRRLTPVAWLHSVHFDLYVTSDYIISMMLLTCPVSYSLRNTRFLNHSTGSVRKLLLKNKFSNNFSL